jgi:hypothetical protein
MMKKLIVGKKQPFFPRLGQTAGRQPIELGVCMVVVEPPNPVRLSSRRSLKGGQGTTLIG